MNKKDRILKLEELLDFDDEEDYGEGIARLEALEVMDEMVSNPVTITIRDEKTGKTKTLPNVRNILLFFQAVGDGSSWGQMAVGDIERISGVVSFLSRASSTAIGKIISKKRRGKRN